MLEVEERLHAEHPRRRRCGKRSSRNRTPTIRRSRPRPDASSRSGLRLGLASGVLTSESVTSPSRCSTTAGIGTPSWPMISAAGTPRADEPTGSPDSRRRRVPVRLLLSLREWASLSRLASEGTAPERSSIMPFRAGLRVCPIGAGDYKAHHEERDQPSKIRQRDEPRPTAHQSAAPCISDARGLRQCLSQIPTDRPWRDTLPNSRWSVCHHYGARPEFVLIGDLIPDLLCSDPSVRHAGRSDVDVQVDPEIAGGSVNAGRLEQALRGAARHRLRREGHRDPHTQRERSRHPPHHRRPSRRAGRYSIWRPTSPTRGASAPRPCHLVSPRHRFVPLRAVQGWAILGLNISGELHLAISGDLFIGHGQCAKRRPRSACDLHPRISVERLIRCYRFLDVRIGRR